jgi:hypothetical protein
VGAQQATDPACLNTRLYRDDWWLPPSRKKASLVRHQHAFEGYGLNWPISGEYLLQTCFSEKEEEEVGQTESYKQSMGSCHAHHRAAPGTAPPTGR